MLTISQGSNGLLHAGFPAALTPVQDCGCRHCRMRRTELHRANQIEAEWHDLDRLLEELARAERLGELRGAG